VEMERVEKRPAAIVCERPFFAMMVPLQAW
jgi:hypothetical protein